MFEKVESEGLLIEWDVPKPATYVYINRRTGIWYKRLKPMMKYPGRRARVDRGKPKWTDAHGIRNNIKRSLTNHDPYERWKIETGKEDDGTYSVWVTYEGRMNEDEYQAAELVRRQKGEALKKQMLKNKIIRQQDVGRSTLAAAIRPPVVD